MDRETSRVQEGRTGNRYMTMSMRGYVPDIYIISGDSAREHLPSTHDK